MWVFDLLLIINLVVALYIWFDTDAIVEWGSLLHLKFLGYKKYNETKKSVLSSVAAKTYCDWLLFSYGENFFIRLITCPICFTVWVNVVLICVFYSRLSVVMLGPNILASWLLYHTLKWILQKLNA